MLGKRPICYNYKIGEAIKNNGADSLLSNVKFKLKQGDLVIGNLEGVVSNYTDIAGFNKEFHRANPRVLKGLKDANFNVLSVANNHIMDHGDNAFNSCINNINMYCMCPVGIKNTTDIIEFNNLKIALIAYSLAEDPKNKKLYNYCKLSEADIILDEIRRIKSSTDFVILLLHWGDEFIERPSPTQIQFAHKAIDAGANAILGHHPHVLQGIELYNDGLIAYSLGNFICDMWQEDMRKSMILYFKISKNKISDVEITPIYIKNGCYPIIPSEDESKLIKHHIKTLSNELELRSQQNEYEVIDYYQTCVKEAKRKYRKQLKIYFFKNFYKYPPSSSFYIIKKYIMNNRHLPSLHRISH